MMQKDSSRQQSEQQKLKQSLNPIYKNRLMAEISTNRTSTLPPMTQKASSRMEMFTPSMEAGLTPKI